MGTSVFQLIHSYRFYQKNLFSLSEVGVGFFVDLQSLCEQSINTWTLTISRFSMLSQHATIATDLFAF